MLHFDHNTIEMYATFVVNRLRTAFHFITLEHLLNSALKFMLKLYKPDTVNTYR